MTNIEKRLTKLAEIERRDLNRFKPNPLGAGYLTRAERYHEVRMQLRRRAECA